MIEAIKNLLGIPSVDLSELIKNGATIIDVRTKSEFASGHIKGSLNIPLDQIRANTDKLKKHNHLIVCCRSGARSAQAKRDLEAVGFKNVTNGGSWQNVNQYK